MFEGVKKTILGMAILCFISGCIEIFAAYLIVKFNAIEKALIINSSLAFIESLLFIAIISIGVYGIADQVRGKKLIWIFFGVGCILFGIK
ncbi:DUF2619 domain-containing protein [Bacillus sp. 31A1R]|uniref:DUF2619 domain-containing protein n=1 Tax=Robertmurraya mangrovi TaxID=3098077 RepID=A0ABU5ITK2_9BACI|nr:DUF2619 domain-containing protein [Bacillus sp. 31A1R]MDZ5470475.1 DUF2619 domain-containing protein [Bacillus sp. 31A1R]